MHPLKLVSGERSNVVDMLTNCSVMTLSFSFIIVDVAGACVMDASTGCNGRCNEDDGGVEEEVDDMEEDAMVDSVVTVFQSKTDKQVSSSQ